MKAFSILYEEVKRLKQSLNQLEQEIQSRQSVSWEPGQVWESGGRQALIIHLYGSDYILTGLGGNFGEGFANGTYTKEELTLHMQSANYKYVGTLQVV